MNKIFKKNRGLCAPDLCSDPPQTLELRPVHFFLAYVMVQYSSANMIRFLVFDHKEKKMSHGGTSYHQLDLTGLGLCKLLPKRPVF